MKRPFGRRTCKWEVNIKICLKKWHDIVDCINLASVGPFVHDNEQMDSIINDGIFVD